MKKVLLILMGLALGILFVGKVQAIEYSCHYSYPRGVRYIAFETNGGNPINQYTLAVLPNRTMDLPTPVKSGYVFDGWYYDANFTQKVNTTNAYQVESRTEHTIIDGCETYRPITRLYAKWIKESNIECFMIYPTGVTYVAFETNGGDPIDQYALAVLPNQTKVLPTPVREGYLFVGWYYDADLTQKVETNDAYEIERKTEEGYYQGCKTTIPVTRLYASWVSLENVQCYMSYPLGARYIEFETNGGEHLDRLGMAILPNRTAPLPTPTREGYTFEGWYYDKDFNEKVEATDGYKVEARTEKGLYHGCETELPITRLYAKWSRTIQAECYMEYPKGVRYVAFETNGGNSIEQYSLAVLPNRSKELPTPVKSGYMFAGWYYDKNFNEKVETTNAYEVRSMTEEGYEDGCRTTIPITRLYAKWIKESDLTCINAIVDGVTYIAFETNGGAPLAKISLPVLPDRYQSLPTPTKDGYIFDGWYYDEKLTEKVTTDNAYDVRSDTVELIENGCKVTKSIRKLYAKWVRESKQEITTITAPEEEIVRFTRVDEKILENFVLPGSLKLKKFVAYEITLLDENNNEVEPNGKVKLAIKIPEVLSGSDLTIYRLDGERLIEYDTKVEEEYAVTETDHFSTYIVAENDDSSTTEGTKTDTKKNPNTGFFAASIVGALAIIAAGLILLNKYKFKNKFYKV